MKGGFIFFLDTPALLLYILQPHMPQFNILELIYEKRYKHKKN